MNVYQEKIEQAIQLLPEFDLDVWLVFARESLVSPPEIFRLPLEGEVAEPLTSLNAEQLSEIDLHPAEGCSVR